MPPLSGGPRPAQLPRGMRLVHPRVRFTSNRLVHVAARSPGIRITMCGRVSVGELADPEPLHIEADPHTGTARWSYSQLSERTVDGIVEQFELTLCPRCAARI